MDADRKIQRGEIADAQCSVEAFASPDLDFAMLEGLWKLCYTTASDVVRPM